MRIISGALKGRKLLDSSNLTHLRPTSDRSRESLFNILNSAKFIKEIDFELPNSSILDICCGSGSVAFEAISRGAKDALLIDNNSQSLNLAKRNAELLNIVDKVEFLSCDVVKSLPKKPINKEFNLIYVDPPYKEDYLKIIENLVKNNWVGESTLLIVEIENKFAHKLTNDFLSLNYLRVLENRSLSKLTAIMFIAKNKNHFMAIDS